MREIKFRAWSEETNEMVKVAHLDLTGATIYFENGIKSLNRGQELSFWNKPFILMQYTGLKDKSGVEIYEGDIVKIQVNDRIDWNIVKGKVVFLEGAWLVEDVGNFAIELWSEFNEVEVIGNIYENPELLETKKSS